LIYVALTRAKQRLYIIHDVNTHKHICSLLIQTPKTLYKTHGTSLDSQLTCIRNKIEQRRSLVDENAKYLPNHIVNDRKDILLVSKYVLPELFALNQKEVMFTNSLFSWKTSVTRFIQSINQTDMLALMDNIKYKKKHVDLFPISLDERKIFETVRKDKETLIGILFEHVFYY
jgi:ATP-dependent exoDNAse (exonuclease V) beta subunit